VGATSSSGGEIAVSLDRSTDAQVVRNEVECAQTCGIYLDSSETTLVLDNVVRESGAGIVARSSDASLFQRNEIRDCLTVGLAIARDLAGSCANAESHPRTADRGSR